MSTLTVPITTDFRQAVLDDVSLIDFTNPAGSRVTALFATTQFAPGPISSVVAIDGSAGRNEILVTGNSIAAAGWTFEHWQASDRITFRGTDSFDEVIGTVQGDRILGLANDDFLLGFEGDDIILGGTGDDLLQGNAGDDDLRGGTGNDHLQGDGGRNLLFGGEGDDDIISTTETGGDVVDGGSGIDSLEFYSQGAGSIVIDIRDGGGGRDAGNGTTIANVEQLSFDGFLGSGDDRITGGAGDDEMFGGAGDDRLYGKGGSDFIRGWVGQNVLSGGGGDDIIMSTTPEGGDTIRGGAGLDRASLHRSSATNFVIDIIDGGGRRDIGDGTTLDGIESMDFFGGGGADLARGGSGVDRLCGGGGDDELTGRGGSDVFIYRRALGSGIDTITDFTQGSDLIDLSAIDAKPGLPGNAFTFIGFDTFNQRAGELRYFQNGFFTFIEADVTGDGTADLVIKLPPLIDLVAKDFVL